jgi:hypothetical protein
MPLTLAHTAKVGTGHLPGKEKLFASNEQDDNGPSKEDHQEGNKLFD